MPASPSRARLPLAFLTAGSLLAVSAAASASTEVAAVSEAAMVASKSTEISLPLKDGTFNLGDVAMRLATDGTVSAQRAGFLSVIGRILRPEALDALQKRLPSDEYVDLAEITRAGLPSSYDGEELVVNVAPGVEQRPKGEITGSLSSQEVAVEDVVQRAFFSGFLNLQFGASYERDAGERPPAVFFPAAAIDGAIRVGEVVLESELDTTWDGEIVRRGSRAVYDIADHAVRMTAGDLNASASGGHILPPVMGFSIERSYQKLQPTRNIRPTGRRSFRIERNSEVEVLLNDRPIRRLQLGPGEYDLDDLPLSAGSNDIKLLIRDETGREETLDFSVLFGRSLLGVDLSEWSLSGGVASISGDTPAYDYSQHYASAAYRRGILENLTGEAFTSAGRDTTNLGLSALVQTAVGLLSIESVASASVDRGFGLFGAADLELALDPALDIGSFNFGVEFQSDAFVTPGSEAVRNNPRMRADGSYSRSIGDAVTASMSARYAFAIDTLNDAFGVGLTLSRSFGEGLTMSLSGHYGSEHRPEDDNALAPGLSVFGRLNYRLDRSAGISLGYDAAKERTTTRATGTAGNGVGAWSTSVELKRAPASKSEAESELEASLAYTGNRFVIDTTHGRDFNGLNRMRSVHHAATVGTAVAFADGSFAIGRPVRGSFAVVDAHDGLKGNAVRLSPSEDGDAAVSDPFGAVIFSDISAYSPSRLSYDVADLPDGYDIGTGSLDFRAPYKAGHRVTIGSGATVMIQGSLRDASGKPLKLLSGTAFEQSRPDQKIALFTNGEGSLSAQGFGPGNWRIEMATPAKPQYTFSLPADAAGIANIGDLRPVQ